MIDKERIERLTDLVPAQPKPREEVHLSGDWGVSIHAGESEIDSALASAQVPDQERNIPQVRAFGKNLRGLDYLQSEIANAHEDTSLPRRLRQRYFRADQLLKATLMVLRHDADELHAAFHAEYLLGKINRAISVYGLEVVKKERATASQTPSPADPQRQPPQG